MAKQRTNPARWKDELDFLGAVLNIRVDADSTIFHVRAPKARVEPVLSLLANLILHPVFSEETMAEAKKDLAARATDSPAFVERARQELIKLMFRGDACGRSQQKDLESMTRLMVPDVEDFLRAHYRPNNAELIVVGAIPLTQIADVVREKFGSWVKVGEPPTRGDSRLARISDSTVRVIDRPNAERALILLGYPLPARQSPDYQSLNALAALLEDIGHASRLQRALVDFDRRQISFKGELSFGFDCSSLQIQIEGPLSSLNATIHRVLDAIQGTKTQPATGEELSLIKSHLLEEREQQIRSDEGLANLVTEVELFGLGRDYLSDLSPRLELLTSEKIQEASKTYLSASRLAMVVAGTRDRIDPELKDFEVQYLGSP
jgi:zinc protease